MSRIVNVQNIKKKIYCLLIIGLIFTSLLGIHNLYIQKERQETENQLFKSYIGEAVSKLNIDYNKIKEEEKIYYYITVSSNIYSAVNLLDLTSYDTNENHNDIFRAIYGVYKCMIFPKCRKIVTTEKARITSEYLSKIIENPLDKQASNKLYKIVNKILLENN